MGSKIYDFLTESFLFDGSLIEDEFASVPETEIRKELGRYRDHWFANAAEIEREVRADQSALKLFSGLKTIDPRLLKQTALYVHQQILTDPLFDLGRETNPDVDAFNAVFGLRTPTFDKEEVVKAVRYLKALTPMVAGDYVKFFPTSRFFEPPSQIPFTYSPTGFAERVPKELLEFFHSNVHVTSARAEGNSIAFGWPLERGRAIAVTFKDHPIIEAGQVFFLAEQEFESVDRSSRTAMSRFYMPDTLPTPERFDAWVTQSINQSSGWVYRRLCIEMAVADSFDANYLSNSEFIFKLIGEIAPAEAETIQPVNALMNINLPILEKIDTETLMKVREDEGEAFAEFRLEWDRQLKGLRGIADPEELKRRIDEVFRELTEIQVAKVDRTVADLKKRLLRDLVIIGTGTLAAAIQAGGFGIVGAVVAGLQGYRSYSDYQRVKRQNPAFFLWKSSKG